jgi:hypothetical protein
MPIGSLGAMRQAFSRDAGAKYGDIVYFSKPADWTFRVTMPHASTYHVLFYFNVYGSMPGNFRRRHATRRNR